MIPPIENGVCDYCKWDKEINDQVLKIEPHLFNKSLTFSPQRPAMQLYNKLCREKETKVALIDRVRICSGHLYELTKLVEASRDFENL